MGWPCPTCGRVLTTRQGMRQHHTKVHGEPLPNRGCRGCGAEFYDPKARRAFCDGCNPNAGEHNGNWRGGMEAAVCKLCGDEFEYYPSEKEGVYCPECVAESEEFLGTPFSEVREVERLERKCDQCDVEMTVLASETAYGNGRFCSRDCLSTWMSENWQGRKHPAWSDSAPRTADRGGKRGRRCEGEMTTLASLAMPRVTISAGSRMLITSYRSENSMIQKMPTVSTTSSVSANVAIGGSKQG